MNYQALGILKLGSNHILVMAVETASHFWLYSVILDAIEREGGGRRHYFCSYQLNPRPTMSLATSEYNVLRNCQSNNFYDMVQMQVPSQSGVDRVLSLDDSFSTGFDMSHLFEIYKLSTGQFFLAGSEKIEINVSIHDVK